jgi:hypothetical protein
MDALPDQRGDSGPARGQESNESLMRNTAATNGADNETSPLLDNGGIASQVARNDSDGHEWEGIADFKGLSWRKTPSVCCGLYSHYIAATLHISR